jgi:hypothetical protein
VGVALVEEGEEAWMEGEMEMARAVAAREVGTKGEGETVAEVMVAVVMVAAMVPMCSLESPGQVKLT